MVDGAPPPDEVLARARRAARGARAGRPQRALRQPRAAPGVRARGPRLARAARALHGAARAPLRPARAQAGLAPLADSLGIEVDEVHRALPDALTCARVFCALFPRLCANAVTVGDALDLLRSRRRARKTRAGRRRSRATERPDLSTLPDDPGVYIFRDERGRPLYVGKSVSLRSRARAHFCAPAGWTERAEIVDYRPTNSELGALVLENRLIKEWKPDGQQEAEAHRPLLLPALPARHPLPGARGGARAGARARRERRAARQPGARRRARRPAHLALPAAPLRAHAEAARAPVRVRADGPLRVALPRRPRPERLPPPARPGARAISRRPARARGCSRRSTSGCARRPRRSATSAPPRCCAAASGSRGCWSGSRACCAPRTPRRGSCSRSTP